VTIKQPRSGLRAGLDAVMLAAACPASTGDTVLEAGSGSGVAGLCLAARVPGVSVVGVEIDGSLAVLAGQNAARNHLGGAFQVVNADVTAPWAELETLGIRRDHYDHVIANPPFYSALETRTAPNTARSRACTMPPGGLERWLRFLAGCARPGGRLTMIHRADTLPELLALVQDRFGGIEILPLYPKPGTGAVRIILRGVKGSRAPLTLRQGLILHARDGTPTREAAMILREGRALDDVLQTDATS
jgi:tRNA1(Val) A37 N6-methylase TrmN6